MLEVTDHLAGDREPWCAQTQALAPADYGGTAWAARSSLRGPAD